MPPDDDTSHLAPFVPWVSGENGRTYTSLCDDSLDMYAIQRPSGENCAFRSLNGVATTAYGFATRAGCPGSGSTQTSASVFGDSLLKSRKRPSFDQLVGTPG